MEAKEAGERLAVSNMNSERSSKISKPTEQPELKSSCKKMMRSYI